MPGNIREYTNPIGGLQPNEGAQRAEEFAARTIQSNYNSIGHDIDQGIRQAGGAFLEHRTREEISQGAGEIAVIADGQRQQWQQILRDADPNDHTVGTQFIQEHAEPAYEAWVNQATTEESRAWRQSQVATLRQHTYERTAADMATRSGEALEANMTTLATHVTNLVANDPTQLNLGLGLLHNSIEGIIQNDPNLTPAQAEHARGVLTATLSQQTANAAVVGMAQRDPAAARALLATGGAFSEYLDGADHARLGNYIDAEEERHATQARMAAAETRRQQVQDANTVERDLVASLYDPDHPGTMRIPADFGTRFQAYAAMPGADGGTARALLSMSHTIVEDAARGVPAVTDPQIFNSLVGRMTIAPGQPNAVTSAEIYSAAAAGHLSIHDASLLTSWQNDNERPTPGVTQAREGIARTVDSFKSTITSSTMLSPHADAEGDQRYGQFQWEVYTRFNQLRADGQTPEQAVARLTDPRSPDYIGHIVTRFQGGRAGAHGIMAPQPVVPYTPPPAPPLPGGNAQLGVEPSLRGVQGNVGPGVPRPAAPRPGPQARVGHDAEGAPTVTVGITPLAHEPAASASHGLTIRPGESMTGFLARVRAAQR